ncbi:MAG: SH3 domain-containing protein [Candidatus Sumerlaeia bacterium]
MRRFSRTSSFLFSVLLITVLCAMTTVAVADTPVYVKASSTKLRAKASSSATPLANLDQFTPVTHKSDEGDFALVETNSGKTGYVKKSDLSDNPFVSVSGSYANMRSGPKAGDPVLWKVKKGWPLKVLDREGPRVKVTDFEGSTGWIYESLLSSKNYVVVKLDWINLREGPGLDKDGKPKYAKRFTAERGVIFEVLKEKDGWLLVRHSDNDEAWCSANIVWGYKPE